MFKKPCQRRHVESSGQLFGPIASMRQTWIALLSVLLPQAQGLPASVEGPVIVLPIRRHSSQPLMKRGIPRQSLVDRAAGYLADLEIGTPPQRAALMVDTGSWITWVNEHPDCRSAYLPQFCVDLPLYNRSASNPAPKRVPSLDQIARYGGGEEVSLQGYSDMFTWGRDTKVADQPFAVVNKTHRQGQFVGVLGKGPDGE